ncbi:MAG: isopentenyl phosphate kinase [Candidatus Methanomethylicia archaeon]|nr:isopentenyl phosphate kinase [Candidatus Methanomethylicia archaeon]MCX8169074.1 isopentenyl phosphate kinase [Candidatus Methanomethylicia archaeon]MDW7988806.1 isopentenyl phosphate kinase [Nitrososphaerota archaeon]
MKNTHEKIIIIKLGGSVITIKNLFETPNIPVINRISNELKEISELYPIIVVHGGGSFGHPHAHKYSINEGFKRMDQLNGIFKTHEAMIRLNNIIINKLFDAGLIPFPFQPSAIITTKMGEIESANITPIIKAMKLGFIPVLYGDIVFDHERGFCILSGDKICSYLAISLKNSIDKVIFSCDVDGIYTSDPKIDKFSKLIKNLTFNDIIKILENENSNNIVKNIDVTGGMKGKLIEILKIVSHGIEVRIINALIPGRLVDAAYNSNFHGSRIIPLRE